MLCIYLFVVC